MCTCGIKEYSSMALSHHFSFILAGIPQGSVLVPFFFLIYINDLADYLHGMARMFADDTSLSFSSNNLAFIEHILNS